MSKFYRSLKVLSILMAFMGGAFSAMAQDGQPEDPAFTFSVTDIRSTDATITITPANAELEYLFDMKTKAAFEADGGAAEVVSKQIASWEWMASWYDDTTWQYFLELSRVSGTQEFSAKDFMEENLMPETDYVLYAYAIDEEGNVTAPVTTYEFTTTAGVHSDNTFDVSLVSITPGSFGRMDVVTKVKPSNGDRYTVQCIAKSAADEYDLTPGTESYKEFVRSEMLYSLGEDEIVSGESEFTFERKMPDTEYSIFVMGIDPDGAASTDLTRFDFVAKQYPEPLPEIQIEVSDVTPMNAHLKITPPSDTLYYYFDVTPAYLLEQKGGVDVIPEKYIIDWWKYIASLYGEDNWQQFIPIQCVQGPIDSQMSDLIEEGSLSNVYWGGDWVVYAVGFNLEGEIMTQTAVARFTTPKPEPRDLTFEFETVSMEKNEQASTAWNRTMFDATIDIYPSDETAPYRFNYMATRYYNQYFTEKYDSLSTERKDSLFILDQFYDNSLEVTDAARVQMPRLSATRAGQIEEYYLLAVGWEEGPTTPLYKYTFKYDEQDGISVTRKEAVGVFVEDGKITVLGDCDGAAVYSAAGRLVGPLRGGTSISVPKGMYVVTYTVDGQKTSQKVYVK